jgi:hypothetical protein
MLRLSETVTIPDGRVRRERQCSRSGLLTPGGYQLHQKGDDGEFRITDEGTTSLQRDPVLRCIFQPRQLPRVTATTGGHR